MRFYRYQNTKEIEYKSRYVDISLLHEDLDEYKNEFSSEKELHDFLFKKYEKSLSLRDIPARELFDIIIKSSLSKIDMLECKYPVNGIFGEDFNEINESYSLEELLSEEELWHYDGGRYLVVYEGDTILNEGDCGIIFKPSKILEIFETNFN